MAERPEKKKYVRKVYTRVERPQRERKTRDVNKFDQPEVVKWTTVEKQKLLGALHRHSPHSVEAISSAIGTKTPTEVEQFIENTVEKSFQDPKNRRIKTDPEKGAAPLELWLSLVQELVCRDKKVDHSAVYAKVLRVIARNEPMAEDCGISDFKWRNLYHFICDLLDDKAVVQDLSRMESLVLLDMMHSLGDTLHSSDMQEQRKILDLKYQLFNWEMATPSETYAAGLKAFNNDFTGIDIKTSTSTCSTSSTSTMASAPPSSTTNIQLLSSTDPIPGPSTQSTSSSHLLHSTQTINPRASPSISEWEQSTTSSTERVSCGSSMNSSGSANRNTQGSVVSGVRKDNKDLPPFALPKLFSLNPLTIPPALLAPKPLRDVEDEIPVIIDFKTENCQ